MDSEVPEIKGRNFLSAIMVLEEEQDMLRIYTGITEYCRTYNIPRDNLLDILEDQKVLPMIRGKATEFVGAAFLRQVLDPHEWSVDKLNLNPQPGLNDEDVSITFRRTGTRLKAETKNAVRGSFRMGTAKRPGPRFNVKCHKSRSNLKVQNTTNDRYLVGEFDLLLCNVSNALFKGKALQAGLPLIENPTAIDWLTNFYGVENQGELARRAYDDWRLCLPMAIADTDGVIPRTPSVMMENDPNWFSADKLHANLSMLINGVR